MAHAFDGIKEKRHPEEPANAAVSKDRKAHLQ